MDGLCENQHHWRIALALIAAIVGTLSLWWSVRKIGRCEWIWLLCGSLLYEAALFIWFSDLFWTWLWTWAGGA